MAIAFMMTLAPFQIKYDLLAYQGENVFDEVFSGAAHGIVAGLPIEGSCLQTFSWRIEGVHP
jgi:hypothetical protein